MLGAGDERGTARDPTDEPAAAQGPDEQHGATQGPDSGRGDVGERNGADDHVEPGVHTHPHRHDEGEPAHVHPHHHTAQDIAAARTCEDGVPLVRDHGHGMSFERYTYLCSPVHEMDPRLKILAALAIVLAVVMGPPPHPFELFGLAAFLLAVTSIAHVPLGWVLKRSALVIPFAGMIALFAPLQQSGGSLSVGGLSGAYADGGWIAAYSIIAKAWLATLTVVVLSATTPVPRLLKGLRSLRVPDVMLMLLSFMYRYVAVMRDQIASMRDAIDSRGYMLSRGRRVLVYGNLAGSMFVRSYERGERVHGAMVSRGFDGTIPTAEGLATTPADWTMFATALLVAAALILY
jgi:cobalt/nickel transport system permease protein